MREELDRLKDPETKAVRADVLEEAVTNRMLRQMADYYPHLKELKGLGR